MLLPARVICALPDICENQSKHLRRIRARQINGLQTTAAQMRRNSTAARFLPCLPQSRRQIYCTGGKRLRPNAFGRSIIGAVQESPVRNLLAQLECLHCYRLFDDDMPITDNRRANHPSLS